MCWHVILRADKRLAGISAVQSFIYQFVVLSKINWLTLKRFEEKYLLLSGFTLEVVQISPAYTILHTRMNETLYRWTFDFHKVVRQNNSAAVDDFILPYSAVYLRIQKWKNYWNRSTFAKVIVKTKVARFLWPTVYEQGTANTSGAVNAQPGNVQSRRQKNYELKNLRLTLPCVPVDY